MRLTGFHLIVSFRVNYCFIISFTLSERLGVCNFFLSVRWSGMPVRWSGRTALVWHSEVARSRLPQCSKSCDLQPALQCAIRGAQGVLPCVGWGVRPVNWIYRL